MAETVNIDRSNENPNPSLEETAAKMGIDVNNIDPTATSQTAGNTPKSDIPDWVPAKFHNAPDPVKAMADAYRELERKQGKGEAEPEAERTEPQETNDEVSESTEETNDPAVEAVEKAGLDFNDLSDKYRSQGKLDDADYAKLEKGGIPKALVDSYIAGQEALAVQAENEVYNHVGGKDTYAAMIEFARESYTPAEIDAYDKAINSANPAARRMAVDGLKARYEATNGREPNQVQGRGRATDGGVYESWAQVQADMADPKYKADPAFRAKVEAKLGRSQI